MSAAVLVRLGLVLGKLLLSVVDHALELVLQLVDGRRTEEAALHTVLDSLASLAVSFLGLLLLRKGFNVWLRSVAVLHLVFDRTLRTYFRQ